MDIDNSQFTQSEMQQNNTQQTEFNHFTTAQNQNNTDTQDQNIDRTLDDIKHTKRASQKEQLELNQNQNFQLANCAGKINTKLDENQNLLQQYFNNQHVDCEKLNEGGLGYSKRVINIKNGYLRIYKPPSKYLKDIKKENQLIRKAIISVENITEIIFPDFQEIEKQSKITKKKPIYTLKIVFDGGQLILADKKKQEQNTKKLLQFSKTQKNIDINNLLEQEAIESDQQLKRGVTLGYENKNINPQLQQNEKSILQKSVSNVTNQTSKRSSISKQPGYQVQYNFRFFEPYNIIRDASADEILKLKKEQEELELKKQKEEEEKFTKQQQEKIDKQRKLQQEMDENKKNKKKQKEEEEQKIKDKQLKKQKDEEMAKLEQEQEQNKKLEEKRRQEKMEQLKVAWEYRYSSLQEELINQQDNQDEDFKISINIFRLIGEFREKCVSNATTLIEELIFPAKIRTHQEINISSPYYNFIDKKEQGYYIENVIYKVAHISNFTEEEMEQQRSDTLENNPNPNFLQNNQQFENIYNTFNIKMLSHEFRSLEIFNDILFVLRKQEGYKIKVPLTCTVEHFGFRVLCIAAPPVDDQEQSLLQGMSKSGEFKFCKPVQQQLSTLSGVLNLRPFTYVQKIPDQEIKNMEIHLSFFTEILGTRDNPWEELLKLENDKDNAQLQKKKKKKQKKKTSEEVEPDFYYLNKVAHVFPLDIDIQSKQKSPLFSQRLRPEFFNEYLDYQISNGAFINPSNTSESQYDDIQVANAGLKLRSERLKQFVKLLDRLELVPVDSLSMSQAFHQNGINMRLLGSVAQLTDMPHVQEICKVEMVARTFKKIFRCQLQEFIFSGFKQQNKILYYNIQNDGDENTSNVRDKKSKLLNSAENDLDKITKTPLIYKLHEDIKQMAVEALNLIMGNTQITVNFWQKILIPQIKLDYGYDFEGIQYPNQKLKNMQRVITLPIPSGALIHAISYHTRIQLNNIGPQLKVFETPKPFNLKDIDKIKIQSKTYRFQSLKLRQLADKYKEIKTKLTKHNYDIAKKSLNIKLSIEKALNTSQYLPPGPVVESFILAELGEVQLEADQYQEAISKTRQALALLPQFHAESIKSLVCLIKVCNLISKFHEAFEAYDNSMKNLEFMWGQFHPLHAAIQCVMADYYIRQKLFTEAIDLLNNSLICCIRILGSNHIQTAEVYQDIAMAYYQSKNRSECLRFLHKSLKVYEAEKGLDSIYCAKLMYKIGKINQRMGNQNEALKMFGQAMKIFQQDEVKNIEKVRDCSYKCCQASYALKLEREIKKYAELTWKIMEDYTIVDNEYVLNIVQYLLVVYLVNLQDEQKVYLFKILLVYKEDFVKVQDMYMEEGRGSLFFQQFQQKKTISPQVNKKNDTLKLSSILNRRGKFSEKVDPNKNDQSTDSDSDMSNTSQNMTINKKQKKIRFNDEKKEQEKRQGLDGYFTVPLKHDKDKISELIEEVVKSIRSFKTIEERLKNMIYIFLGKYENLYNDPYFFNNFKQYVNDDYQFNEAQEFYQQLIQLYGEEFFKNVLTKMYPFPSLEDQLAISQMCIY